MGVVAIKGFEVQLLLHRSPPRVLVPISSTSVERVFSHVKYIMETVGMHAMEETMETRVMECVNCFPN